MLVRQILLVAVWALAVTVLRAAEPAKLDSCGDPLPPGAVQRLGTMRLQCQTGFVWMPDGKSLASVAGSHIRFWDASDGRLLKSLEFPDDYSFRYRLAIAADESKLVCASSEGNVAIYDLKSGAMIFRPTATRRGEYGIEALAIAPDGSSFVTATRGATRLWDPIEGKVKSELPIGKRHRFYPGLAYSPDGRRVAIGVDNTIQLFDVDRPEMPAVIEEAHGDHVISVAFMRKKNRLVSTGMALIRDVVLPGGEVVSRRPPELRVWDLDGLTMFKDLKSPASVETGGTLALDPEDNMAVVVHRGETLVWDLAQEKVVRTIPGQKYQKYNARPELVNAAIDPAGNHLAVNGGETHLALWDLKTGEPRLDPGNRHSDYVTTVAFSPDDRLIATGSADKSVRVWDAATGKMLRAIERGNGWPRGLAFTTDSRHLIVAAEDYDETIPKFFGALRSFRVSDGALVFEQTLAGRARCLALSHDATRIAVGTGVEPDPEGAAAEGPPQLLLFDAAKGQKLAEFDAITAPVVAVAWSPDDSAVWMACMDNSLRQFNVKTKTEVATVDTPHTRLEDGEMVSTRLSHAVFPRGKAVALTSALFEPAICNWNLKTGAKAWTLPTPSGAVRRLAASPDGRIVACVWKNSRPSVSGVCLWEIATQRELLAIDLEGEDPYAVAFSSDGRRIATGFAGGTAVVWDVAAAWDKLAAEK